MITRRGWRTSPVVDTNSNAATDPYDIAANMDRALREKFDKAAVQPTSTIYDQITSIINNVKPKFPSVEAAVIDMQERSGFATYQKGLHDYGKIKQAQSTEEATMGSDADDAPQIFKDNPTIKETFDNYINDTRGNISVPAVLDRVKSIHKHDATDEAWNDDKLMEYVDKKCHEVKDNNPSPDIQGLGKMTHFNDTTDVDPSNRDAFFSLNPSKAEWQQDAAGNMSVKTASSENALLIALSKFDTKQS